MGDVHLLRGDFDAALRSFETASAMADGESLRLNEHKLGRVYLRLGDFDQARDRFQSALLDDSVLAPDKRASVLADWSLLEYRDDNRERARDLALDARRTAESAGSSLAQARALTALGIIARREEQLPDALRYLEEALRQAEENGAKPLVASALNALALTQAALQRPAEAIALGQRALVECAAQGDRQGSAAVHSNLADLFHATGDEASSRQHLTAAASILGEIGVVRGEHRPEVWRLVDW
jgi:tetratricopeptide (TPR) repeat protein